MNNSNRSLESLEEGDGVTIYYVCQLEEDSDYSLDECSAFDTEEEAVADMMATIDDMKKNFNEDTSGKFDVFKIVTYHTNSYDLNEVKNGNK